MWCCVLIVLQVHSLLLEAKVTPLLDDDLRLLHQDDAIEQLWRAQQSGNCYQCPFDTRRVQLLCAKSASQFIEQPSRATFVLFHLNVDTESKLALISYAEASERLGAFEQSLVLGAVACHNWPDVCRRYKVSQWPRLLIFSHGRHLGDYDGIWQADAIVDAVNLYRNAAPLLLESAEAAKGLLKQGAANGFSQSLSTLPAVTVGLFEGQMDKDASTFAEVAVQLQGRRVLAMATGAAAKEIQAKFLPNAALPLIFSHKIGFCPTTRNTISKSFAKSDLIRFCLQSFGDGLVELTESTLPAVVQRRMPQVLLVTADAAMPAVNALEESAVEFNDRFTFSWLNSSKMPELAASILKAYGAAEAQAELLVVIDGHQDIYYSYAGPTSAVDSNALKNWLAEIVRGQLKPGKLAGEQWQPTLLFDYLEKVYGTPSKLQLTLSNSPITHQEL